MSTQTKQKKNAIVKVKPTPPVEARAMRTINDLMQSVEDEIQSLKDGDLSEPKARVIANNRHIQLKAFELILNAAKLEARLRPELGRRIGILEIQGQEVTPVQ